MHKARRTAARRLIGLLTMLAAILSLGVTSPGSAEASGESVTNNAVTCQAVFDDARLAARYGIVSDGSGNLWGIDGYSGTATKLDTSGATFIKSSVRLANEYSQYGIVSDDDGALWSVSSGMVTKLETADATFTRSDVRIAASSGIVSDDDGALWSVSSSTATKVTTSGSTFKENGGVRIADGTSGIVSDDNGALWSIGNYSGSATLTTDGSTFKTNGGVRIAGSYGIVSDDEGALWVITIDGDMLSTSKANTDGSTFKTNGGVRLNNIHSAFVSDDDGTLMYFYLGVFGGVLSMPPTSTFKTNGGVRLSGNNYGIVSDDNGVLYAVATWTNGTDITWSGVEINTEDATFGNSAVRIAGSYGIVSDDDGSLWGVPHGVTGTAAQINAPDASFMNSDVRFAGQYGIATDDNGNLWSVTYNNVTAKSVSAEGTFKDDAVRLASSSGIVSDDSGTLWGVNYGHDTATSIDASVDCTPDITIETGADADSQWTTSGSYTLTTTITNTGNDSLKGLIFASKSVTFTPDAMRADDISDWTFIYKDQTYTAAQLDTLTLAPGDVITGTATVTLDQNSQNSIAVMATATGSTSETKVNSPSTVALNNSTFTFTKTDADGNDLNDAEFTLFKVDSGSVPSTVVNPDSLPSNMSVFGTGMSDPTVTFDGLDPNSMYRLVETQAPGGYVTPSGQWNLAFSQESVDTGVNAVLNGINVPLPVWQHVTQQNLDVVADADGTNPPEFTGDMTAGFKVSNQKAATPGITVDMVNDTGAELVKAGDHTLTVTITNSGDDPLKDLAFASNDSSLTWVFKHGDNTNLTIDDLKDITLEPSDTITGTTTVTVAKNANDSTQSNTAAVVTATGESSGQSVNDYDWVLMNSVTFEFTKTDDDGNDLNDAEFSMYEITNRDLMYSIIDTNNLPEGVTQIDSDTSSPTVELDAYGSYQSMFRVVETKAPEGFITPSGQWNLIVALHGKGKVGCDTTTTVGGIEIPCPDIFEYEISDENISAIRASNNSVPHAFSTNNGTRELVNTPLRTLPTSGHTGLIVLFAVALVVGALASGRLTTGGRRKGRHQAG